MATIKFKRGTRSELNTAASSSELVIGEPYLITDESVIAIGTAVNAYQECVKKVAAQTLTAGESITVGDSVGIHTDGKAYKAQASSSGKMPAIACATTSASADATFEFITVGVTSTLTVSGTPSSGDILYISDTTAGACQAAAPDDPGERPQAIGVKLATGYFVNYSLNESTIT